MAFEERRDGGGAGGDEPMYELWEARDSGTLRAMHTVLVLIDPEGNETVLDRDGWEPTPAVQSVLAAARFLPGVAALGAAVLDREPELAAREPIRGFRFAAKDLRRVESVARQTLAGTMGGWRDAVIGAIGFHANPLAFAMAWEAAGRPSVLVRGPAVTEGDRRSRGTRAAADRVQSIAVDLLGGHEVPI